MRRSEAGEDAVPTLKRPCAHTARWWAVAFILAVGVIVSLSPRALAASPGASAGGTVGPLAAAAIGLLYYLSYSPWLGGLDYYWLYRPLVGGFLVGLILGQPLEGAMVGATINLAYLGFISADGTLPGDPSMAGYLGTTIALTGHLSPAAALALAVPIGLLGTVVWNFMMTFNSIFVHRADAAAARGDIAAVERAALWYPQGFLLLITAVPVFFAVWLGAAQVVSVLDIIPNWLMHGLGVAGGLLAALGIGINMRAIFRGPAIGFFLIGYVVIAMLHWSLVPLALVGAAGAYIYVAATSRTTYAASTVPGGEALVLPMDMQSVGEHLLTPRDVRAAWLRWFLFAQCSYSWERLQGTGFVMAMIPVIRRLWRTAEQRAGALQRHLYFFNTEQTWGAVIPGAVAAMEETGARTAASGSPMLDTDVFNSVKTGLMGPMAGFGDTIDQGTVTPILLALGIGLTKAGSLVGPVLFMLLEGIWIVGIDYTMFMLGFTQGRSTIQNILSSGRMGQLTEGARLLGGIVLGGLAATYVTLSTPLVFKIGAARIPLQAGVLDKLLPGVLPLAFVLAVWALLRHRVKPVWMLLSILAFGVLGGVTGWWQ